MKDEPRSGTTIGGAGRWPALCLAVENVRMGVAVASAPGASQGEGEAGATQADKSSAQTVSRIS